MISTSHLQSILDFKQNESKKKRTIMDVTEIVLNKEENEESSSKLLDSYIDYLYSKNTESTFLQTPKRTLEYETYLKFHSKRGIEIDELFLKCIRDNHMIMFRKMLTDVAVNQSYKNNEAVILCVLHDRYFMLTLLLQNPRVNPQDQNNLALRIAIQKKDKRILDLLLKCQSVLDQIYQEPDLLSYIYIYQNNGNVIF